MLENIEYLPKKDEFRIGDVKNLAVSNSQKDDMAKMYPKTEVNSVSNADMLSQSFNTTPQVEEIPKVETEPVQISSIPNVQNNFNMEANPVDLSVNSINPEPVMSVADEVPNLEVPKVEPIIESSIDTNLNVNNAPVIEPITSVNQNNGIDSEFKVSNQPNIFDVPQAQSFGISQDEINKPLDNSSNNDIQSIEPVVSNNLNKESNIFEQQPNIDIPQSEKVNNVALEKDANIKEISINDDIILGQIAIEESNVKHYEALAENSKKRIELYKRQLKKKQDEVNLENTASDLFNNNGILDDEKVLGKTPMPNIVA